MGKIKVASFGVGVIGSAVAKFILDEKQQLELVGAFDIDKGKVGKDLGEVIGLGRSAGVVVTDDLGTALKDADIAIHTTTSYLKTAYPQLASILSHGVDVISSCEELSYPYVVDKELSGALDSQAKKNGATVLGTGINPGFLMDALPIALTAPCKSVGRIKVSRRMNAATRRVPFQKKVGAGLNVEEFDRAIKEKRISGHVGLEQSVSMLADALGWKLDKVEVGEVEPVISESGTDAGYVAVQPGSVAGVNQAARGYVDGDPRIELNFAAYVGSDEEYDQPKAYASDRNLRRDPEGRRRWTPREEVQHWFRGLLGQPEA